MKILIGAGFVIFFIVVAFLAITGYNDWEDSCVARGGHVSSHTDWNTTYDYKGTAHSNSNTTYYCLSNDGRILDIR